MAEQSESETAQALERLKKKHGGLRFATWLLSIPGVLIYLVVARRCIVQSCTSGEWFITFLVPGVVILWAVFYLVGKRRRNGE
jgi:hypothetical protein